MHDPEPNASKTSEDVRIVIVEDDDDTLEALMAIVELDGYRVEGAGSAKEALDIIERDTPHCVVLDLGLPDLSGAELAQRLRSRCGNELVLIVITGTDDRDALEAAEEAGVDYLLRKPLDIERFRRLVPPLH